MIHLAVLIVFGALVRIRQRIVGFLDQLELLFRLFVAAIEVRVIFARQPAMGLPNLFVRRLARHAQYLIVVFVFAAHAKSPLPRPGAIIPS